MYVDQEKQFSFTSGWFEVPQLDQNDELVKIAKVIDWDSLTEVNLLEKCRRALLKLLDKAKQFGTKNILHTKELQRNHTCNIRN